MKDRILRGAKELGFDDCRFTTAEPPASAPHFKRWLEGGQHGEMHYLDRNAYKRVEPQQVLGGARSIISLAVSYHYEVQKRMGTIAASGSGVIAAYARFTDYH